MDAFVQINVLCWHDVPVAAARGVRACPSSWLLLIQGMGGIDLLSNGGNLDRRGRHGETRSEPRFEEEMAPIAIVLGGAVSDKVGSTERNPKRVASSRLQR